MLAHAEKAADAEDDVLGLAGLADDQFLDVADLLIGVVADIDAVSLEGLQCGSR